MRCTILFLPLLLAGCASPPTQPAARYSIWRSGEQTGTFACRVAPETRSELASLVRASLAPAGLYEDVGDSAIELSARLDVGQPRMTEVERWSELWKSAAEDRRFVEVIDRNGRPVVLRASHPQARHASRRAVLLSRSTLVLEARQSGRPLWCAEIVIIAPEDEPQRLASLLHPSVSEVLLLNSAPAAESPLLLAGGGF